MAASHSLEAATLIWDPNANGGTTGGSGTWDNGTVAVPAVNWFDGNTAVTWLQTSDATFGGTAGPFTVAIDAAGVNANSLTFTTDRYTIAGPGVLTLSGPTVTVGTGLTATVSAAMTASSGLTLPVGNGTLILGGANTFTGSATINGGTLRVTNAGALTGSTGNTIATGGTLEIAGVAITQGFGIFDGGTLAGSGTGAAFNSTLNIDPAATSITLSALTSGQTFTVGNAANSLTGGTAGTTVINVTGPGTVIQNQSTNVAANWVIGTASPTSGTLQITNLAAGLGAATNTVTVNGGGTLSINAAAAGTLAAYPITLNGGRLQQSAANVLTLAAAVNVTGTGSVFDVQGTSTTGKILVNAGFLTGSGSFSKTGAGDLQLAGANAGFTGTSVSLSAGVLEIQNVASLGTTPSTVTVTGGELVASNITWAGAINVSGGTISGNGGNSTYSGPITSSGNFTFGVRDFQATGTGRTLTVTGALSGTGVATAGGGTAAGVLNLGVLNGPNTLTGFTGTIAAAANATVNVNSSLNTSARVGIAGGSVVLRVANSSLAAPANLGVNGVNSFYYNEGSNIGTGSALFATDQLLLVPRVFQRTDGFINLANNGSGVGDLPILPVPGFAIQTVGGVSSASMFKGLLNITTAGNYQFSGTDDDGLVLIIDGIQVGTLGVIATSSPIGGAQTLSAGYHSIVVKHTQGTGGGYATLSYTGADTSNAVVLVGTVANSLRTGSLDPVALGGIDVSVTGTLDLPTDATTTSLNFTATSQFNLTTATISDLTVTGASTITGSATGTLNNANGRLIFNGGIGETAASGALTVAATAAQVQFNAVNTYTGPTTVSGGQLVLNATGGNSIAGNLTINAANTVGLVRNVVLQQSDQIADNATVTISNRGVLDLGVNSDTVGGLAMTSGFITGSGTLTIAPTATTITLGGGTISAGLGGTFSGANGLTKNTASTLILSGSNTYTGQTLVTAGVLRATGTNALGAAGALNETIVSTGATLELLGGGASTEAVSLSGNGVLLQNTASGALRNTGGTNSVGAVTLLGATGSTITIESSGGSLSIAALNAATLGLTIQGAGNLVLGSAITSPGTITKNGRGGLIFGYDTLGAFPAATFNSGILGFSGTQTLGAATVGVTGYANATTWQFNSDPGLGTTVALNGNKVIAGFTADQNFLGRLSGTGQLALTQNQSNNLDFTAAPNVSLGASGLVVYSGTLTAGASGFNLGAVAGATPGPVGLGIGQLQVTSVLAGTAALNINGDVRLIASNTFTGAVTINSGGILRTSANDNLGTATNVVNLNGGTLQVNLTSGNAGNLFAQNGNPVGPLNAARVINVTAGGGTIDVPAQSAGSTAFVINGTNTVTGSGALTKTGLGFLILTGADTYSGALTIATNGNQFDIRGLGSLANVASITINAAGVLNLDNNNGLGQSRQGGAFAGTYVANRVNDAATITLNGGSITYTDKAAQTNTIEVFGALISATGQNALNANSNAGTAASVLTFGALTRTVGSTIRYGGTPGTLGAGTAGVPGAGNTQITFTGQGAAAILPYATLTATSFVGYSGTAGIGVIPVTPTTVTTAAGFTAATIGDQTADVTLTGNVAINALRQSGGAIRNTLFTNAATDTLFIVSGALLSDGAAFARNIGSSLIQGNLTAGAATGNAAPQELFLHNNANTLTIFSKIIDNNGQAVTIVKDVDGTVTLSPTVNLVGATSVIGSATVTLSGSTTAGLLVGQPVTGIAGGAFVASITDATHFVMNGNATAVVTNATIQVGTPNTFTGGVFVDRGTLTSAAVGALGAVLTTNNPTVVTRNATLSLNNIGAVTGTVPVGYNGAVYTTPDQSEILLAAGSATAAGQYNYSTDRFSISAGSSIYGSGNNGAGAGLNSLTRVATATSFTSGGQIFLAADAIVRQNLTNAADQGTGTLTIQNLGTNADLYFSPGNAGGELQSITVGSGTAWKGLSTDRNAATWSVGTIFANSDFYLQGLTRDNGIVNLGLGASNSLGTFSIVNNSGGAINAFVIGGVTIDEDSPVRLPGDLTFVLTAGSVFSPNRTNALGAPASLGGTGQAKILVQAGATLDPGNYVPLGAVASTNINPNGTSNGTQNLAYALASPVNTSVTVEAGGRFLINDPSGIGSANVGSWTLKSGSVLDLGNTNAFYGRGAYGVTATGTPDTTGVIQNGQFNFESGVVVRINADNIYRLTQFTGQNAGATGTIYEVAIATRTLTNQNNPFLVPTVGIPTIAPENLILGSGDILTNDDSDRQVSVGRGRIILQNGAILAGTTQTYLNLQQGFEVAANATITIGTNRTIDGSTRLGGVQLLGANSNVIPSSVTTNVADGAQLTFSAANVWSDNASINLTTAVTAFPSVGANSLQPGTGTSILLNVTNFTEVVGQVNGSGAIIANTAGSFLGLNVAADYSTGIIFKNTNGQQANLYKLGAGTLTMTGVSDSTGQQIIAQGNLVLSGTGKDLFNTTRVGKGATVTLDNNGTALNDRLGGFGASLAGLGGTVNLIGNATTAVTENLANLFNSAAGTGPYTAATGLSFINVTPGAATTTLLVSNFENFQSAGVALQRSTTWVLRSPTLGNQAGTYSVAGLYTPNVGNVTNGYITVQNPNFGSQGAYGAAAGAIVGQAGSSVVPTLPNVLGDTSPTGQGSGFVTEDALISYPAITTVTAATTIVLPTVNGLAVGMVLAGPGVAAGTTISAINAGTNTITLSNAIGTGAAGNITVISGGVRLLTNSEYASSIPNNATTNLNVRIAGTANVSGDARIQTLTLTPGSTVNIGGTIPLNPTPTRLFLSDAGVLVQSGGAAATINGTANTFLQSNPGTSLFLHVQGDLNLNTPVFSDNAVVKTGGGTLNVGNGAFNYFRGGLQIDGGTVNLGAGTSLATIRQTTSFTSNTNLTLNGGTLNLGGNSQVINTLVNANILPNQGGTLTSATAATLTVLGGGSFSGQITGAVGLDKPGTGTLELYSNNTYTGNTLVRGGTLSLRDSGALSGTTQIDVNYGTLSINDGYLSNVDNRINTGATVNLRGSTIALTGAAGQVATQTFGTVNLVAARSDVNSNAGGAGANVITFTNLNRTVASGATITFNQNYGFLGTAGNTTAIRDFITNINGSSLALVNNILPAWIVANGDHFATYNATTGLSFLSNTADGYANYESNNALTATATQNVNDGTNRAFVASSTFNAWRIAPNAVNSSTFAQGVGLTLASGGLLTNNNNTTSLGALANSTGQFITSGTGELDVWINQNTTGINIPITGAINFVKSGAGSLNLNPSSTYNTGVTVAINNPVIAVTNTTGLAVGQLVSGLTGVPNGATITAITPNTNITVSTAPTAAGTAFTVNLGNTYTGTTYATGGGILQLNLGAADGNTVVAIPGDLVIQNGTTVTEANVANQFKPTANVTLSGTARLNFVSLAGVTEQINSITVVDPTGQINILDRTATQPTSIVNLRSPTAITVNSTNPSGFAVVGSFLGQLGFTPTTGNTSAITINAPVSTGVNSGNGLNTVGLQITSQISSVASGAVDGGLVKAGTGQLVLGPTNTVAPVAAIGGIVAGNATVTLPSTTGLTVGMAVTGTGIVTGSVITSIPNGTSIVLSAPATTTNAATVTVTGIVTNYTGIGLTNSGGFSTQTAALNVATGIVRADNSGALGTPGALTTVQDGAVLLGNSNNLVGSISLKDGSSLGVTLNSSNFGAVSTSALTQSVLLIGSGPKGVTLYADDYFIQGTNNGNLVINSRLTGAGNINILGPQITGGAGLVQLANVITSGTGSNDYTGTITVNPNAILRSQAVVTGTATGITGSSLGTSVINLNGGTLSLRDDLSTTAPAGGTTGGATGATVAYATNVNLSANSFLEANRTVTNTSTINNIVNLGTFTVAAGTQTLTVNSGNGYQVGIGSVDGPGTLQKGGTSILNINGVTGTGSGNFAVAAPQGLSISAATGLVFNGATNTIANLTVGGVQAFAASKAVNITGTLDISSNSGGAINALNGATQVATVGSVSIPSTATITVGTLRNNGQLGSTGGTTTVTATNITGSGFYQTLGQGLILAGNLADDGANATRLKVAGDNTVTLRALASTNTGGAEVQSGVLLLAPTANAVNPLGTGATPIRVLGSAATTLGTNSQGVAAVIGELRFGGGANTITQAGNIINSGLVHATSGSTTIGGTISGSTQAYVPGLLEGRVTTNQADLTAARPVNPGNFGVRSEPRFGQTNLVTQNGLTGWSDNTAWVYTGQYYNATGSFSFAENIDDITLLSIDGVTRISNGTFNQVTGSAYTVGQTTTVANQGAANAGTATAALGMGPNSDGWHTFEVRFVNGSGGAGPVAGNGFFTNYGFGVNTTGATALDGTQYQRPIADLTADPNNAAQYQQALFRTAVAAKGTVLVDSAAFLSASGITSTAAVTLAGGTGDATLNLTGTQTNDVDNLSVAAAGTGNGVVNLATNSTLNVGTTVASGAVVTVPTGRKLSINSTANVNGTLRVGSASTTMLISGTLEVNGGLVLINSINTAADTGNVTVQTGGKLGGTGKITAPITLTDTGTITAGSGTTLTGGSAPGILTVGSLSLAPANPTATPTPTPGATYVWKVLNGAPANVAAINGAYDQIAATSIAFGTPAAGAYNIAVVGAANLPAPSGSPGTLQSYVYQIASIASFANFTGLTTAGDVTSFFNVMPDAISGDLSSANFKVYLDDGTNAALFSSGQFPNGVVLEGGFTGPGIDLVYTPTPEPVVTGIIGLAALALAHRPRRRRAAGNKPVDAV